MSSAPPAFSLRLLGGCVLAHASGPVTGRAAQRRRLAVLAIVAAGGRDGATRDRIVALLWPEGEPEQSRRLLADTLYIVRSTLGEQALRAVADRIALSPDVVGCDVVTVEDALRRHDPVAAVAAYGGPFLDGFHVPGAPEFERWVDGERERLETAHARALEGLACDAQRRQDRVAAAECWRRLAAVRPYDGRIARRLAEALDAAGDRGGAVAALQAHAALLRHDLDVEPDGELLTLIARLRIAPPTAHVGQAPVPPPPAIAAPSPPEPASVVPASPVQPTRAPGVPTPWRTRRVAAAGLLAVAVAIVATTALTRRSVPAYSDQRVVVAPFSNETDDSTLAPLGRMAADWVTQGLSAAGLADVVPTSAALASARYVDSVAARGATDRARLLGAETGAALVVSGSVYRVGDSVQLRAEILDARRGRLVRALDPIAAPVDAPMSGVETLRRRTLGALAPLLDERLATTATLVGAPPSYAAYREFTEGMRFTLAWDFRSALGHFERASAADSTYLTAVLWTALAHANLGQWSAADTLTRRLAVGRARLTPYEAALLDNVRAWLDSDWQAAYDAASRAARLAPRSMAEAQVAQEAVRLNRPQEAVRILERLDPERGELRGYRFYWAALVDAYHHLRRYDDEVRAARRAYALYPGGPEWLEYEARALAALGEPDSAVRVLDTRLRMSWERAAPPHVTMLRLAKELRAHGHPEAARAVLQRLLGWLDTRAPATQQTAGCRACRAEALDELGRAREALPLFVEALAADSGNQQVLRGIGVAAVHASDRAAAARIDARLAALVERGGREVPIYLYDRALIAAQLGDRARATALIREALARGLPYTLFSFHSMPALEPLRGYPPFETVVRSRE